MYTVTNFIFWVISDLYNDPNSKQSIYKSHREYTVVISAKIMVIWWQTVQFNVWKQPNKSTH